MAPPSRPARPATLAVVVSAGVSTYLPRTLAGIAGQSHVPDAVLVVDVSAPGRDVGTGIPIHEAVAESGLPERTRVRAVGAPEAATFGEAVSLGLEKYAALLERAARREHGLDSSAGPRTLGAVGPGWRTGEMSPVTSGEMRALSADDRTTRPPWLWLLHDDSAPAPAALDRLLHAAESGRSVAVAGTKQRDWARPDDLLQVGLRTTRSARRVAEIEIGEIDQGQHDDREDVLAVGLAGALVRRDVWEDLGGTDPALGPYGDGLDLCRRARLAGHRVVVVPTAWVHHARASYLGLRGAGGISLADEQPPDERRSFLARRRAQLYNWLKAVPAPLLPLAVLAIIVLAPLRALSRIATKEIALAGAEIAAVPAVLGSLDALRQARHQAAQTQRVPSRTLKPLQARGRDIARIRRDVRRQHAASRRAAEAPSELEIAERAALARRRRVTAGGVLLVLTVVALWAFGPLLLAGPLTGGALRPADASWAELWRAARSGWVPAGLGEAGPADALLTVLAVPMTVLGVFGASTNVLVTLALVAAVPAAGLGAWFAAGAATRSVLMRAWAALVWALAPALLVSTGQGRLGAVLAHLALPWVALGVARAVGVHREDVILSGMVGARRAALEWGPEREPGSTPVDGSGGTAAPAALPAPADAPATAPADAAPVDAPPAPATPADPPPGSAAPADSPPASAAPADAPATGATSRRARSSSLAAAAGAGLALGVATAGAPVLLPTAVLLLLLLAVVVPRHRRRLLLVAVPALVLHAPMLMVALGDLAEGSWRLLLADPGAPYGSAAAPAWQQLLGWPVPALAPWILDASTATAVALAGGAALVLGAVLALLRGSGRARAVRTGWVLALVGLLVAGLSARTDVAVGPSLGGPDQTEALVRGWTGPGVSLLTLGLLLAVLLGGDGLLGWLTARSFGWRQLAAVVVAVVMVAAPAASTAGWLLSVRADRGEPTELLTVHGRPPGPVPALATELQTSDLRSRVLALRPAGGTVHAEVWRAGGPQLTTTATVVAARGLSGPIGDTQVAGPDDAEAGLARLIAAMAAGAATDAGQELGEYAVGVVLVPPLRTYVPEGTAPTAAERTALVAQLDATAGLERVTENDSGVIWRVATDEAQAGAAGSVARARLLDADGAVVQDVPADPVRVATDVAAGEEGRTVVLAERADDGWRAWYDGRPLRAVTAGWRQAFEVPAEAGTLTVSYDPPWRTPWNIAQIVVLGLTVLLALPLRRRRTVVA